MLYDARTLAATVISWPSCHTWGQGRAGLESGQPQERSHPTRSRSILPTPRNWRSARRCSVSTPVTVSAGQCLQPAEGSADHANLRGLAHSGASCTGAADRSSGLFAPMRRYENLSFQALSSSAFQSLVRYRQNQPHRDRAQMQAYPQIFVPANPDAPIRCAKTGQFLLIRHSRPANASSTADRPARRHNLGALGGLVLRPDGLHLAKACHQVNPAAGQFGTSTNGSFEGITQIFKIPHLRNEVTRWVCSASRPCLSSTTSTAEVWPQVRGFGFTNEGSVGHHHSISSMRWCSILRLTPAFRSSEPDATRRNVEQYVLAFDTDLARSSASQVTLTNTNSANAGARVTLLEPEGGSPLHFG